MCFVYDEEFDGFLPWARNSSLGLGVGAPGMGDEMPMPPAFDGKSCPAWRSWAAKDCPHVLPADDMLRRKSRKAPSISAKERLKSVRKLLHAESKQLGMAARTTKARTGKHSVAPASRKLLQADLGTACPAWMGVAQTKCPGWLNEDSDGSCVTPLEEADEEALCNEWFANDLDNDCYRVTVQMEIEDSWSGCMEQYTSQKVMEVMDVACPGWEDPEALCDEFGANGGDNSCAMAAAELDQMLVSPVSALETPRDMNRVDVFGSVCKHARIGPCIP